MTTETVELPPLPEPAIIGDDVLDGYLDPDAEYTADQMREYALAYGEAVREACAKVAEGMADPQDDGWDECLRTVAAAIRGA